MKSRFIKNKLKGFTLIELMVTLSIIMILGGITISSSYKENKIKNSILLDTESVAISIRDMQNRTINFTQNPMFNNIGYGVFFNIKNSLKVETFYKLDGDFKTTELSGSENIRPSDDFIFTPGNYIRRICLNGCSVKVLDNDDKLAVYFVKPKQYANFSYSEDGLNYYKYLYPSNQLINNVCIEIGAEASNDIRKLYISYIGQIFFNSGYCEN